MARSPSPAVLAAITACVVVAGAGAGLLLQPTKDPTVRATKGARVDIDVVAPSETVPEPGSVMDVGDLADGYIHRGQAPLSAVNRLTYDAAPDEPPASVELRRVARAPVTLSRPAPSPAVIEERERPLQRPIGLDQPRPDYAVDRRERRSRLAGQRRLEEQERLQDYPDPTEQDYDRDGEVWADRDRRGRARQWYGSDGRPVRGPEFRD